ncbi:MAG: methyltransferase domain-containing protein [Bryobacteraceae bacterium]|nr:methyltransferase domain-containing protein [Bryobacteraceae bacterium]
MTPLVIGNDKEFERARKFFRDAGFNEKNTNELLGFERLWELSLQRGRPLDHPERLAGNKLGAIITVFLIGGECEPGAARKFFGPETLITLGNLDLLRRNKAGNYVCPVMISPVDELWFTSDRAFDPENREEIPGGVDSVFTPQAPQSPDFRQLVSRRACDRLLDLGTGCGLGALIARFAGARQVTGLDVNQRAIHFARFNAHLNGMPDVRFDAGDLFAPVRGETFDRIVFHAPYDLVKPGEQYVTFAAGGEDGEALSRRGFREVHAYVAPGGRFICATTLTDRADGSVAERIRGWLGDHSGEFDLMVLEREKLTRTAYLSAAFGTSRSSFFEALEWETRLDRAGVKHFIRGGFVLQRKPDGRPAFTHAMRITDATAPEEIEDRLDRLTALHSADWDRDLMSARPALAPDASLVVKHRLNSGAVQPVAFQFEVEGSFPAALPCGEGLAMLAGHCTGKQTAGEILAAVQKRTPGLSEQRFREAIHQLVLTGVLEIPLVSPLPAEG